MRRAVTIMLILALAVMEARAVTVGDVTRVEGQRINKLHGLGLVVGLAGTGDSGDYAPAIRPLAALLQRLADPVVSASELKATKNVALVTISVTVPASGARKVEVEVPEFQRANPVPFLGDVLKLSLRSPLETAARVEINDHTGTIVITGNVEISAAVISHPTLTLSTISTTSSAAATTSTPNAGSSASASSGPAPAPDGPFAKIDPTGEGGVRLQDLVNAMNTLKVPAADQIAIIKLLSKGGRIHGEVIFVE